MIQSQGQYWGQSYQYKSVNEYMSMLWYRFTYFQYNQTSKINLYRGVRTRGKTVCREILGVRVTQLTIYW